MHGGAVLSHDLHILWKFISFEDLQMIEKPFLAKSNGIKFRNFGHKQGIQVLKRNSWIGWTVLIAMKIDATELDYESSQSRYKIKLSN